MRTCGRTIKIINDVSKIFTPLSEIYDNHRLVMRTNENMAAGTGIVNGEVPSNFKNIVRNIRATKNDSGHKKTSSSRHLSLRPR